MDHDRAVATSQMRAATGRPRPRLLVAIVATVLGLTAALLAGCGSDGTDDAETGTTADGTADEAPGTDDGADPPDDGTTGTTVAGATGVDCLTGEMELVSAESTAALPGVPADPGPALRRPAPVSPPRAWPCGCWRELLCHITDSDT